MKILVIEDNPDIKEILDYILVDEGHEVIPFPDDFALTELGHFKPDLILMDEVLEGVRGSDLIKKLKADADTHHIPVVLISAMPDLKAIAAKCGADNYIEKPFSIEMLTDIIKNFT